MKTAETTDLEDLQKENQFLHNEVAFLKEQLAWFKRQIFGKRSERVISKSNEQQLMLEGFSCEQPQEEEKQTVAAHPRRKPKRKGQDKITLSPDLPVETTVLDLPEEEKALLVKIGEEVTHKLVHKPGSYFIREIIRPKYANPQKEEAGIFIADLPDSIIPKCRADESLLAEIVTKKFADHLPLYRTSEIMKREGVGISHKLLSQWVVRLGNVLKPLYTIMLQKILESNNVFIDESPVDMQAPKKVHKGYMWVLVGGNVSDPPYRIYDYRDNRRHENVLDILKDYRGVLHSDKYGAYENLANAKKVKWCPCWSHIRRKFVEAESGDLPFRNWVLRKIRYLFMLERVAWTRDPNQRLQIRKEKEEPIIDELIDKIKERLVHGKLLPKAKLREALGYFCGLIPYLKTYINHPYARMDNNVAERAVRPLAIGRKNWLFFGSLEGGKSAAVLLSLVQTCRGLGINPREYLEDVFRKFMGHNSQKIYEFLPDQWLLNRKKS